MFDIDFILCIISQWKYFIVIDLISVFYQILLVRELMCYCGIVIFYKGVCVYIWCVMGMLGLEIVLEEFMCRVLGDYFQVGFVLKLVDDLYCGGNILEEFL